jgi:hypothetical protein
MKRIWLICLLGLWGIAATSRSPVAAQVLTDKFPGIAVNRSLWNVDILGQGPGYGQGGGSVAMFLPSYSAGAEFGVLYRSVPRLRGDFDMQVDYSLPLWPPRSGIRVGLGDVGSGVLGAVERVSWARSDAGPPGDGYVTDFRQESSPFFTPTSDMTGKLRLVRSGAIVLGFRWDSRVAEWILIHSGPAPTTDIQFGFGAWSLDTYFTHLNGLASFSNFVISHGTLIGPNGQPF